MRNIENKFQKWSLIFDCYITLLKSFWPPSSVVMNRHSFNKCLLLMILFKSSFEFTFWPFWEWGFNFYFRRFFAYIGLLLRNLWTRTVRKYWFLYLRIDIRRFHISAFSDYDLSLICTSKCDDVFLQCIASCSDSNCVLDCNRASLACSEGEFHSWWSLQYQSYSTNDAESYYSACPCHTDCLEGCNNCENPICFCNVSQSC